jgi:hypothetical protein
MSENPCQPPTSQLPQEAPPSPTRYLMRCVIIWLYVAVFLVVAMNQEASPIWLRIILIALLAWMTYCTLEAFIGWLRHHPNTKRSATKP